MILPVFAGRLLICKPAIVMLWSITLAMVVFLLWVWFPFIAKYDDSKPEIAVYSVAGQCLYTDLRLIKMKEGKWGKCGPPWGIIAVYNVTRKESSCEQRQQIPCSNFTILLNKPSNAQGGVYRADFSGINIVSSFQWLHEPAGRNGQLNPGAGCYNDCISNKLNSVKVCFQARGSGWLYRLVVGTRHCSCHEPICTASSSPQTGFGSQLGAGTVPSTQLGCSCWFLCQVALLPETGPRPVSFINLGVFHISGAPRSCGCLCWWGVRLPMGNWFCDLKKHINKLSCWFKQDTALKMGLPVNISAHLRSVTISLKSLNLSPKIAWDS